VVSLIAGDPVADRAHWIDGSMPTRAETVRAYCRACGWPVADGPGRRALGQPMPHPTAHRDPLSLTTPDILQPGGDGCRRRFPILLLIDSRRSWRHSPVCARKEFGHDRQLLCHPVNPAGFLVGKQLPYVALAMLN